MACHPSGWKIADIAALVLILQVFCLEVLHVFLAIKDPTEVCSLSGQGKF
jgi:hypothetical protein